MPGNRLPAAPLISLAARPAPLQALEPRLLLAANVVINELHVDPPIATEPAEYIELHNAGDAPADVSGWFFDAGITYTFPPSTSIAPGGFLVIAQNPATIAAKFGAAALGPWTGRLANDGERITLRDSAGVKIDEVDYGQGFPWPTVGSDAGYSMELIHPALDNDLGGSWRSSQGTTADPAELIAPESTWRYFPGTAEPSSQTGAWRQVAFNDAAWLTGTAAVGYGEQFINTALAGMSGGYSTVYFRKTFHVDDPAAIESLLLHAQYDDGINVWINGTRVAWANVSGENLPRTATTGNAIENVEFVPFTIPNPSMLTAGTNVIAVQLLNASLSGSSDAFFDARLVGQLGQPAGATPGAANSVFAENAPPQMRQVEHAPLQPASDVPVAITVKATDPHGVASVILEYQVVEPGDYIALSDPRYQTLWTALPMHDDGTNGDALAGDSVFTATIPASAQQHRRLIRYRITSTDGLGASVRGPYPDDPQPNFAYFVYDGVPDWSGAIQPGSADPLRSTPVVYTGQLLQTLPTYHLITTRKAHEDSQFIPDSTRSSGYTGSDYLWEGTFVYDGVVHDHVDFRARGGVWRYAMGKNMWKFDFTRGHSLQARDNYGNPYDTAWDKLNLSAVIQQGDFQHRGEQGLFESVGFELFDLAGVEGPNTHFIQFRIIDGASENGDDQYSGDFQGLYLAIEQPDGRLLDEHGLPDGNLYKMEGGTGTLNNQGPTQPSNRSDLDAFQAGLKAAAQTDQWFIDNVDLDHYFSYRSIVEAIHHYDIGDGKNYYFYHNPDTNQWSTLPWDLDLTWADNMYGSGAEPLRNPILSRPAFATAYRNRMREVLDLLYNAEQTGQLIDAMARLINTPLTPGGPTLVDADRAMWDFNPILVSPNVNPGKAGNGRYYQRSATGDFEGMAQLMKNYVASRTAWITANILTDESQIPQKPVVTYGGPAGFPLNQLAFDVSAFAGSAAFAAMEWRIAEVTDPAAPGFDPMAEPKYEIEAAWESGEIAQQLNEVAVDGAALTAGRTYRVRVRMKDAQGRFSHWSAPVQFVAGDAQSEAIDSLRITELNYNPYEPPAGTPAPIADAQFYEFIELANFGPGTIQLQDVAFTRGITFNFSNSGIASIAPGQRMVLARNIDAFTARYGDPGPGVIVVTGYTGALDNAGERITLVDSGGGAIHDFTYDDAADWPQLPDGDGATLVVIDVDGDYSDPANWRASQAPGGTPGSDETADPPRVTQIHVAGSDWSPLFYGALADLGLGDAGYRASTGAGQLVPLPWAGIDRISLTFSMAVDVRAEDLIVRGVTVAAYTLAVFHYDPATLTATWSLAQAFAPDRVLLQLDDRVRGVTGAPLDGEWPDDATASGDGAAGGDLLFRLNVLPGDADRSGGVQVNDAVSIRNAQLKVYTPGGSSDYGPADLARDIDGSGAIDPADVALARARQFTSLPQQTPALPSSPATFATVAPPVPLPVISLAPRADDRNVTHVDAVLLAAAFASRGEPRSIAQLPALFTFDRISAVVGKPPNAADRGIGGHPGRHGWNEWRGQVPWTPLAHRAHPAATSAVGRP